MMVELWFNGLTTENQGERWTNDLEPHCSEASAAIAIPSLQTRTCGELQCHQAIVLGEDGEPSYRDWTAQMLGELLNTIG